jgi:predicted RND superfamily exporter protein
MESTSGSAAETPAERFANSLSRGVLARPGLASIVLLAISVGFAAGIPRVQAEFGYRVLVGSEHPAVRDLEGFIESFGGGMPVYLLWACSHGTPCSGVFDASSLDMAHSVTRALGREPGIRSVHGVANAPLLVPTKGGFAVRRFVEHGRRAADANELASRALEDPLWRDRLVSADASTGVIIIQPTDTRNDTSLRLLDAIEDTLQPFEAQGFRFYLVGDPVGAVIAGRDLSQSTSRLVPATVLVIALVVLGLSRAWQHVVVSLATMGTALLWTFGLLGWLGWPQDGILEVLAPLILVVGVCDSIHLLSRVSVHSSPPPPPRSFERRKAVLAAVRDVAAPCLMTSLTTASAFFSFTTSALDTFVRFGVIAAFGVLAAFALTFSLLPLLAWLLPEHAGPPQRATRLWHSTLAAVVRTTQRRAIPIVAAAVALSALGTVGWVRHLDVDTDWYESFGERSPVIQAIRFMERQLGQSETLEIQVSLPNDQPLADPATLAHLRAFTSFLGDTKGLARPRSALDVLARLNRLVHDDDPAFERLPSNVRTGAELIELAGLDDPEVLDSWLTLDRTQLRISVDAPEQSYARARELLGSVRAYADDHLPADWRVLLTGQTAMNVYWVTDIQQTQLRSFPLAFALVFAMLALFLGSVPLALAGMLPTTIPVLVTLGTMGFVGMNLDFGRAMIAAIMLGIAVDDSIHVLYHYRRRRNAGSRPREAMTRAILHTGRAVVTTSVALALGFLTLMASAWQTISSFGFFVAVGIVAALVATLYALPAVFFALDPE